MDHPDRKRLGLTCADPTDCGVCGFCATKQFVQDTGICAIHDVDDCGCEQLQAQLASCKDCPCPGLCSNSKCAEELLSSIDFEK